MEDNDGSAKRPADESGEKTQPHVDESIAELVIEMSNEASLEYIKIVAAMRNLGHGVSRQTISTFRTKLDLAPAL